MTYPNCDPSVALADCSTRATVPTMITLDTPRYCPYVKHNSWGDSNALADYYQPFSCKLLRR